ESPQMPPVPPLPTPAEVTETIRFSSEPATMFATKFGSGSFANIIEAMRARRRELHPSAPPANQPESVERDSLGGRRLIRMAACAGKKSATAWMLEIGT